MRSRHRPSRRPALPEPLECRRLLSTTYYVSPAGNDANPGTSTAQPFQTLAAINKLSLQPGDAVRLLGGATFTGTLKFGSDDVGTKVAPITVTAYGSGRATISAGSGDGIDVIGTSGFALSNLNVEGSKPSNDTSQGIDLFNNRTTGGRLDQGVAIDSVDVGGFGLCGIGIGAATLTAGFDGVSVTHATLHDDVEAGLQTYAGNYTVSPAAYGLAHKDLYIADVDAYDNAGNTIHADSGNGILLGDVADSTVEHCVAHDNGANRLGAPCGIWTYNSDHVTIQYNQSYANHGKIADGDGFDLDGGTTNATLQYNYSHDNGGSGILLCQFADATAWGGNVVRYNISQNDGRANAYPGIYLYTPPSGGPPLNGLDVYGNTVYLSNPDNGTASAGLLVVGATNKVHVYNNVFDVAVGLPPINVKSGASGLTFGANDYWSGSSATSLGLKWLGTTYNSLAAFRSATGQETVHGSRTGLAADPGFAKAGGGPTVGNADDLASHLSAYQLAAASPLVDAGVSLSALGIVTGGHDFFGTALPQGPGYDIGSGERAVAVKPPVVTVPVTSDPVTTGPVTTPPVTTGPVTTGPVTTGPVTIGPVGTDPGTADPTTDATPTTTAVTVSAAPANPVLVGSAVTLTATVTPAAGPTGTLTFTAGTTVLGTADLSASGTATLTTTALPVGIDAVTAAYGGDGTDLASVSAAATVVVNPAALVPTLADVTRVPTTAVVTGTGPAKLRRARATVTVTNAGTTTSSGRITAELLAAPNGVADAAAIRVGSVTRRVSLVAGKSIRLTIPLPALPAGVSAGNYTWLVRTTDAAGHQAVSPAGPTLAATAAAVTLGLAVPVDTLTTTAGRTGGSVGVSVVNTGTVPTMGRLTATLYLSTDGLLAGAIPIARVVSGKIALPRGSAVTLTVSPRRLPAAVAAGTYTVLAAVTDAAGHGVVTTLSTPLMVTSNTAG